MRRLATELRAYYGAVVRDWWPAIHAVLEADCTGCELCLPVCPMDCIALEEVSQGFGLSRPIDTNETDAGRQNNRRVEFHILEEGGAPGTAP